MVHMSMEARTISSHQLCSFTVTSQVVVANSLYLPSHLNSPRSVTIYEDFQVSMLSPTRLPTDRQGVTLLFSVTTFLHPNNVMSRHVSNTF